MTSEKKSPLNRLLITSSPHFHENVSVARIMWEVNLALLPALFCSLWFFGVRAFTVIVSSILGASAGAFFSKKVFQNEKEVIRDGSVILTGLLLAFCVPAALPWWIAFIGGFIAIFLGKEVYGGLGKNIFNPAHVGRAILLASWPLHMTTWLKPCQSLGAFSPLPDGVTGATPLGFLKETMKNSDLINTLNASGTHVINYAFGKLGIGWSDMLVGSIPGSLGETGKIALLIGGVYLLFRGYISLRTPLVMAGTVFFGVLMITGDPIIACYHLLGGGLIIGALFMATDMVTSPLTPLGQIIFAFGCGAITLLIRMKGGYPEGVCYSILIMNSLVPLIDKFIIPRKFGALMPRKAEAKQ